MTEDTLDDGILTVNMNTSAPLNGKAKFTVYIEGQDLLAVLNQLNALNGLAGTKLIQIDCDPWDDEQ